MSETSPDYSRPLVDVVMPVYNKASTVAASIQSVKEQTLSNFACWIVNDGSTDDSEQAILEAIKDDPRFHYISQDNHGVAISRNVGVFHGSAPYVCCLDSDDRIAPLFLEVCVKELEKDPAIGIAYTGLWSVEPDGKQGLSPWPGKFDFDRALTGANQIPTCNVARREVWERTGGQRQRYAPYGCGEEDAEMWLRAGALGFGAKLATDAGLFIYSWKSGAVSGNHNHKMTPYRSWHPWVEDGEHPFASVATPKRMSHKVRQYDDPVVSVIIPVSNAHTETVIDALDSLEAQTFRQWEAIVVDDALDAPNIFLVQTIERSFPFVRYVRPESHGAGAARNAGAKVARAPFLLFLDADDFMNPDTIRLMLDKWKVEQKIIYTDYIGKVRADLPSLQQAYGDKLIHYNERLGEAAILYHSSDYDCEEAVNQPRPYKRTGYPYLWCLITSLVPKQWHDDIGGFDTSMPSWEDWDYWIRLAKAGHCFSRIAEPLITYRFYSGERREVGLQAAPNLIQYLEKKYEGVNSMPCNCRETKQNNTTRGTQLPQGREAQAVAQINDSDLVLCLYTSPNRGDHRVVGGVTGRDYGYRTSGARFLVHQSDIRGQPHLFKPIQSGVDTVPVKQEQTPTKPPELVQSAVMVETKPPEPVVQTVPEPSIGASAFTEEETIAELTRDDLQAIPGVSAIHAQLLNTANVFTYQDLINFGVDNLKTFKGIGDAKAEMIIDFAKKKVSGTL